MNWVRIKDRLPELDQWVLAYGNKNDFTYTISVVQYIYIDSIDEYFWNMLSSGCGCCDVDLTGVTHWMPLPESPEDKEENES